LGKPGATRTASGYGAPDAGFDAFDRRERSMPEIRMLGPADLFGADRAALDFVVGKYRTLLRVVDASVALSEPGANRPRSSPIKKSVTYSPWPPLLASTALAPPRRRRAR
jgi:hypothetical protein